MKVWMRGLMVGGALLYLVSGGGCERASQPKVETDHETDHKWENAVSELAKRHGAVVDWGAHRPKRRGGTPYSIDVSTALVRSNGRPVLLVMAHPVDVIQRRGYCVAVFNKHHWGIELSLELRCTKEQVAQLLREPDTQQTKRRFAVVAKINSVLRPKFKAEASEVDFDADDGVAYSGIELTTDTDVFVAAGDCLELLQEGSEPESSK